MAQIEPEFFGFSHTSDTARSRKSTHKDVQDVAIGKKTAPEQRQNSVPVATSTRIWAKIGILSFGGPAAQIALMHRTVVDEEKWLEEKQFLNALNFCMLLPGPEAMQLATYVGWRMHGVMGGLIAGLLFVIPGALVILLLAALYAQFGAVPLVDAAFLGVKAAVLVIVVEALMKVSKRALVGTPAYVIAALAFIGIFFLKLPYPLIVALAAIYGFLTSERNVSAENARLSSAQNPTAFFKTILIWLMIWWAPIAFLWLGGSEEVLIEIATFFSKLAVVTFGGAYAVLAYMAQDVVEAEHWLSAREMVDGLGLAETTPGPLILVTEFVGFLAAEKVGGFWLGVAGAAVTLWVTFIPCFLWIFAGAPYIDLISAQPRLRGALSAITAAVVGVILNLAIWFALNVAFENLNQTDWGPISFLMPNLSSLDWRVIVIGLAAAVMLLRFHMNLMLVLTLSALAGLVLSGIAQPLP